MFSPERVVYKRLGDRELDALIYRPDSGASNAPVCFWFHGGGWISGDGHEPEIFPLLARGLLDAGAVIVSCEYRLADGENVLWRELVDDCSDFVRFFAKNGERFGLDLSRSFAAGISAGGHLSLLEAFGGEFFGTDDGTEFPRFRFVLDICGPVDMRRAMDAKEKGALSAILRRFLGNDPSRWDEISPLVSPIDFAGRRRAEELMPVMAVHSTADEVVHPCQPEILRELYAASGAEFELLWVENGSHGFANVPGLPPVKPGLEEIQQSLLSFALGHM